MFKMTWGHTFEQNSISRDSIKKMEFCNNLDSVVDYDEFNMPLMQYETRGLSAVHGITHTHPTLTEQETELFAKINKSSQ